MGYRELLLTYYLVTSLWIDVVASLKIRVLDVPQVALAGKQVYLTCDYDLERQSLYMVKWYKGSHEFYRYSPSDRDKIKLFLVNNLRVDVQRSDDRVVVLRDLHVDMTGRYTCEVSTERIFETVHASANMTVVALPRGGPHIQGYPNSQKFAKIGDELNLNCTSLKSKPAALLEFRINNRRVSGRKFIKLSKYLIMNEEDTPQTESAILSMKFKIKPHLVHHGRIRIKCEASIMNVYKSDKEIQIFVETHKAENLSDCGYSIWSYYWGWSHLIFMFTAALGRFL